MLARRARRPGETGARSEKLAISFDRTLAARVRKAAGGRASGNISAWLAEAAREQLRRQAGQALLEGHESEHGPITAADTARVLRQWPRD